MSFPPLTSQTVYDELRRLARSALGRLEPGKTLQPTALVNEVWLRLAGKDRAGAAGRREYVSLAARAMRDILVEEARRKGTRKRGGDWLRADPERLTLAAEAPAEELLALNEALERLEQREPRQAQIVQLRFFAGLTVEETAEALQLSERTVRREWSLARLWLFERLSQD